MEFMYLDHNFLSGSIPEALFDMTRLREFYLYNNQLTGAKRLSAAALCTVLCCALLNSALLSVQLDSVLCCVSSSSLQGRFPPRCSSL